MNVLSLIFQYIKKKPIFFSISFIAIVLDIVFALVPPLLLQYGVDNIIMNDDTTRLLPFVFIYVGAYFLLGLFDFLKGYLLIKISQGVCKEIRLGLLSHVQSLSYLTFTSYDIGTIENYFTNEVDTINTLISDGVISMAIDLFKMIGVIISLFCFSTNVGLITLFLLPIIIVFTLFIRKKMYIAQHERRKSESNINKLMYEDISSSELIRTYSSYEYVTKKYESNLSLFFSSSIKSSLYDSFFSPVMQILKYGVITLFIVLSSYSPTIFSLSIGQIASLIDLIGTLFTPIEAIGMEIQTIQSSYASINRINDFFKEKEDETKEEIISNTDNLSLEFKHVYFSYDKVNYVINDFCLIVNQGQKITFEGVSGVGKSTLFKLAYGLIKPDKGEVTCNGIPTYLLSPETRKNIFGIVFQDYFFSSDSIRNELTLRNTAVKEEEIISVLNIIGLSRVKDLDKKLNEKEYSSGELALFNIARVLLSPSKIIFLDEMNSKIDPQAAKQIICILNEYAKDKTVISISHFGELLKNSEKLTIK